VRLRPRGLREGQSRRLQLAREYKGLVTPSFSSTCAGAPRRAAQVVENEALRQSTTQMPCQVACQAQKKYFFIAKKSLHFCAAVLFFKHDRKRKRNRQALRSTGTSRRRFAQPLSG
jgi:hypothetical protein